MKPEKAEGLTLDAFTTDKEKAAKKGGVSVRTVERAMKQVNDTPALAESVSLKKKRMAEEMHDVRVVFLKENIRRMHELLPASELRDVAGAYKIVSDHQEVAMRVLEDADRLRSEDRKPSQSDQPETREGLGVVGEAVGDNWLGPAPNSH